MVGVGLRAARLRDDRGAMQGGAGERVAAADGRRREHRVRLLGALRARQQLRLRRRLEGDPPRLQVRVQGYRHEGGRGGGRSALGGGRREGREGVRVERGRGARGGGRRGGLGQRGVEAARGGGAVGGVVPARRLGVAAHQRDLLRLLSVALVFL